MLFGCVFIIEKLIEWMLIFVGVFVFNWLVLKLKFCRFFVSFFDVDFFVFLVDMEEWLIYIFLFMKVFVVSIIEGVMKLILKNVWILVILLLLFMSIFVIIVFWICKFFVLIIIIMCMI